MPFLTDVIVRVLALTFLYKGAKKGFLKTLFDPISLILGCLLGLLYYYQTQNFVIGILIAVFGPFVLNIVFSLVLKAWNTTVNNGEPISILSRFIGAVLCLLWRGLHLATILILIAQAPTPKSIKWFNNTQQNVKNSQAYELINKYLGDKIPGANVDLPKITAALRDPKKLKQIQKTPEFQEIMSNKKFQDLFSDQDIVKAIKQNDFGSILSNPKMKALLQDPGLIKKFFALQKKIMDNSSSNKEEEK